MTKERIKTEKEAVIAAAASWNLKDLTEKAKKAPADYLLKRQTAGTEAGL